MPKSVKPAITIILRNPSQLNPSYFWEVQPYFNFPFKKGVPFAKQLEDIERKIKRIMCNDKHWDICMPEHNKRVIVIDDTSDCED
jgi:hypothetical protein